MSYSNELIGEHESIVKLRKLIDKVAFSSTKTVLIYGETGTGKGLVSRIIHNKSDRQSRNFVDINCAAIPPHLLESELFGFEKGAFTGATTRKVGLLESANQGTLFLDEIRELDLVLQAKLLSILDTQQYRRVGSVDATSVDVRVIAATNRILYREVQEHRFREDLYFRLQVVSLNIPPLRERGDDCFLLIENLLENFRKKYDKKVSGWEPAIEDIFRHYYWPGNVRELENLVERIFILEDDNKILVDHIPDRILREVEGSSGYSDYAEPVSENYGQLIKDNLDGAAPENLNFHAATAELHTRLIKLALKDKNNNIPLAASSLGMTRHSLRHHMNKLGIN